MQKPVHDTPVPSLSVEIEYKINITLEDIMKLAHEKAKTANKQIPEHAKLHPQIPESIRVHSKTYPYTRICAISWRE